MTLYFEDRNYALTEVTIINDMQEACAGVRHFLGSQHYNIPYMRFWVEEDNQIDWCVVIDYGSWNSFFKIGGFNSAVDADVFLREGITNAN